MTDMRFRFRFTDCSKGVSPVVGMVLVLAIIAGVMSIIQIKYVPQWDYKREAQSFNTLVSEVSEIPALLTSKSGSTSLQVDVGVNYPQYPFLVNPLSSYGTVKVIPENVSVSYSIYNQKVRENYSSSAIIFEPTYLYMPRVNLTYEHGAVIEYGQNYAKPIMLSQVAFSKNEINLPIVTSKKISVVAKSYVLHFYLISKGAGKTVYNLTVSFKTLYPELWKQTLSRIYGNSAAISVSGNLVTVRFKKANIRISNPAWYMSIRNTLSKGSAKYVSAILSMPSHVYLNPSGRASITLQVLDRYGNPMDNVSLRLQVDDSTVCQLLNNNTLVSSMVTTTGFSGVCVVYVQGLKQGNTRITVKADLPASKGGTNVSVISVNVTKKTGSGRYTIDIVHANGTLVGYYSYGCCCCCCRGVDYDVYSYDILARITPRPPELTPVTVYFLNGSEAVIQTTGFCNSSGYVHVAMTVGVRVNSTHTSTITPQKLVDIKPDTVVVSVGASSAEKAINYT